MWIIFFIIALLAAIILFVHINLELNALEKNIDGVIAELRKHYGLE